MKIDPRLERLSPVILGVVLALAAGFLFGLAALGWISGGENLSSVRTAVSATALLSIYATVSENGLKALGGLWEYIKTGSWGSKRRRSLFTPMVKLTAVAFLLTCSFLLYYGGGEEGECGSVEGEKKLTEIQRLKCEVETLGRSVAPLEGELSALKDNAAALRKDLEKHGEATMQLRLDNIAAFPLVFGNARLSNGGLDKDSDGIGAGQAVNFDELGGAVNTIAEVVESRTRADCGLKKRMQVVVSGYASEAPFAGFANSDDLNLRAANLRSESVAKVLCGKLREKNLSDVVGVSVNTWPSYESMRAGRRAFDEGAARLEETDHWLIGRSVFIQVGEPPACFAVQGGEAPKCFVVPRGQTPVEPISN